MRVDPYQDVLHPEPDMDQRAAGMGGQMWSTAGDVVTWAQALMGRRPDVVAPDVVEAMHTLRVMVDPEWSQGWGLGLILTRRGDRVLAGHTGAMPGFSAALAFDRSTGAAAVVLANTMAATGIRDLALRFVELAIDHHVELPEPEPWVPAGPCPPDLAGVLGPWWSESGQTVFSWRADALEAELVDGLGGRSVFERLGPDEFRVIEGRELGERLVVHRGDGGAVASLEWATYPYTRQPR